jgi:aryl-alcohol dehydrogenase-like predicted oxidoreductase
VVVATKGGHTRRGTGWELDGSPAYLRRACEASLRRLGVEAIGLYQHHRPDPSVPYDETLHGLLGLLDAGLALRVGISNADASQIERACEVIGDGFVSVQNQFSPVFRSSADELALCERLGLAFLPWSPVGGMGGMSSAAEAGTAVTVFGEVAEKHQVSAQQVCLAWELAQSPVVIPIPGASRPESVADSVRAVDLVLDQDDMDRLNRA